MPLAVPSSLLLWPRTVEVVPVQVRQPSCTSPRPGSHIPRFAFRSVSVAVIDERATCNRVTVCVLFQATQTCEQSDVASMIHAEGRCQVLRKIPRNRRTTSCPSEGFLSFSPSESGETFDRWRQVPTSGDIDRHPQSCIPADCTTWIYSDPPMHPSTVPSRRFLLPPRSGFDSNSSPISFDKLPLCSTEGSCCQRTSSVSRQNSRSFQGSVWFLQFSRPFQDLENGFRNSSTFQGFQGPYAPCDWNGRWPLEWKPTLSLKTDALNFAFFLLALVSWLDADLQATSKRNSFH